MVGTTNFRMFPFMNRNLTYRSTFRGDQNGRVITVTIGRLTAVWQDDMGEPQPMARTVTVLVALGVMLDSNAILVVRASRCTLPLTFQGGDDTSRVSKASTVELKAPELPCDGSEQTSARYCIMVLLPSGGSSCLHELARWPAGRRGVPADVSFLSLARMVALAEVAEDSQCVSGHALVATVPVSNCSSQTRSIPILLKPRTVEVMESDIGAARGARKQEQALANRVVDGTGFADSRIGSVKKGGHSARTRAPAAAAATLLLSSAEPVVMRGGGTLLVMRLHGKVSVSLTATAPRAERTSSHLVAVNFCDSQGAEVLAEPTPSPHCPLCDLRCTSAQALIVHLVTCHPGVQFTVQHHMARGRPRTCIRLWHDEDKDAGMGARNWGNFAVWRVQRPPSRHSQSCAVRLAAALAALSGLRQLAGASFPVLDAKGCSIFSHGLDAEFSVSSADAAVTKSPSGLVVVGTMAGHEKAMGGGHMDVDASRAEARPQEGGGSRSHAGLTAQLTGVGVNRGSNSEGAQQPSVRALASPAKLPAGSHWQPAAADAGGREEAEEDDEDVFADRVGRTARDEQLLLAVEEALAGVQRADEADSGEWSPVRATARDAPLSGPAPHAVPHVQFAPASNLKFQKNRKTQASIVQRPGSTLGPQLVHVCVNAPLAASEPGNERIVGRAALADAELSADVLAEAWHRVSRAQPDPVTFTLLQYCAMWESHCKRCSYLVVDQVPQAMESFVREHRALLNNDWTWDTFTEHLRCLVEQEVVQAMHALHCLCLARGQAVQIPAALVTERRTRLGADQDSTTRALARLKLHTTDLEPAIL